MALAIKKPALVPHLVTAGCGVREPGRLAADFLQPPYEARIAVLRPRNQAERGQAGDLQGGPLS